MGVDTVDPMWLPFSELLSGHVIRCISCYWSPKWTIWLSKVQHWSSSPGWACSTCTVRLNPYCGGPSLNPPHAICSVPPWRCLTAWSLWLWRPAPFCVGFLPQSKDMNAWVNVACSLKCFKWSVIPVHYKCQSTSASVEIYIDEYVVLVFAFDDGRDRPRLNEGMKAQNKQT